jgi:hypothetical protein
MVGGNAQKALQDYTQNYAQTAYQNAFANYQGQRQNIYNNLNQIAGYGMTGTQGQANAMLGTGTNIANVGIGASNAVAGSQVAQGQIAGNTISGIASGVGYYGMNQAPPISTSSIQSGTSGGGGFTPAAGSGASFTLA